MNGGVRVVVAHRDGLVRDLAVAALDTAATVVATTDSVVTLRSDCAALSPDVVVSDLELDDGGLASVLSPILRTGARVLVACDGAPEARLTELLLAGASGYLPLRDTAPADLVEAVLRIARGEAALHPAVAAAVLEQWRRLQSASEETAALTVREAEVLTTIAEGHGTKVVARLLGVSVKTVEQHKTRIFAKLGARNQAQAVSIAATRGLLAAKPRAETPGLSDEPS